MGVVLSELSSLPGFVDFIKGEDWQQCFSHATRGRGANYARQGRVSGLKVEYGPSEYSYQKRPVVTLRAKTKGSGWHHYNQRISFSQIRQGWDPDELSCSCPVGYACKHSHAVLSVFRDELAAASRSAAQSGLSMETSAWFQDLQTELETESKSARTRKVPPSQQKVLAFCLVRATSQSDWHLKVGVGKPRTEGGIDISSFAPRANPAKPPSYMNEADILLISRYLQLQGGDRIDDWGPGVELRGSLAGRLLLQALEAKQLYLAENNYAPAWAQLVSKQKQLELSPGWEEEGNGFRPVLHSGRTEEIALLAVEPPQYLDSKQRQLGPVKSDWSAALLKRWSNGPLLSRDEAIELSAKMEAISPDTAAPPSTKKSSKKGKSRRRKQLPPPLKLERTQRGAETPQPVLQIAACHFNQIWGRLSPYQRLQHKELLEQKGFIVASPTIAYGDSPAVPMVFDDDPIEGLTAREQQIIQRKGPQETIWPRDAEAEVELIRPLLKWGLGFVRDFEVGKLLTPEQDHCLVGTEDTDLRFWSRLSSRDLHEQLVAQGWRVEVHPELAEQLTIHEVEQLDHAFAPLNEDGFEANSDGSHEDGETEGIDWFSFRPSFELNGQRISLIPLLPDLIEAAREIRGEDGQPTASTILVQAPPPLSGLIQLPTAQIWPVFEHLLELVNPGEEIKLDRLAAAALANSLPLGEDESSATARALASFGRSLNNLGELPEARLAPNFSATLRDYQRDGVRWLQFLAAHQLRGILADDMGLGKTVQTLAWIDEHHHAHPQAGPSLVIAPTSVLPNWQAEAKRFTPDLKVLLLHGPERKEQFDQIEDADLVLSSYPLLARDQDTLLPIRWSQVIFDEAQALKNPATKAAQVAARLQAPQRLCLSGTPMENHLGELWSLSRILMPGYLGSEKEFNALYRRPIERQGRMEIQQALNRRVAPLILRRTKEEVATELPAKTELLHRIQLSSAETKLYESVRAAMDARVRDVLADQGLAKSQIVVLDALLKLRQVCCHPSLVRGEQAARIKSGSKLSYLLDELLPTLIEEGRRVLIFSQFTSLLSLIETGLQKNKVGYLKLTGQSKKRGELVETFQRGETPVFLISLKAGGTGLNLTAADTVIHYDPWWNPAAENQATDRAHRIGQTRPVFVHRLICEGSIEERIRELQARKSALVEALLSSETSSLKLDQKTLGALLAPLGEGID